MTRVVEQFRDRLIELRSVNDVKNLIRELLRLELDEPIALPYFVVRSILEGLRDALADRPVPPTTWDQLRDALSGPMERVIDSIQSGDRRLIFERLNDLAKRWALTRQELAE